MVVLHPRSSISIPIKGIFPASQRQIEHPTTRQTRSIKPPTRFVHRIARSEQRDSFLFGQVSVTSWGQIAVIAPLVVGGIIAARFFAFHLNAFSLGEEGAAYLGIEVERDKILILALGSLLTAAAVSISGLVGFVGLVMPHAVRLILGPDHRVLLPAAALAGATFVVVADLLARVLLAPVEIPVGVITAVTGAPFFLYLLRHTRKEYAF